MARVSSTYPSSLGKTSSFCHSYSGSAHSDTVISFISSSTASSCTTSSTSITGISKATLSSTASSDGLLQPPKKARFAAIAIISIKLIFLLRLFFNSLSYPKEPCLNIHLDKGSHYGYLIRNSGRSSPSSWCSSKKYILLLEEYLLLP